jgi:hypothetical protein
MVFTTLVFQLISSLESILYYCFFALKKQKQHDAFMNIITVGSLAMIIYITPIVEFFKVEP